MEISLVIELLFQALRMALVIAGPLLLALLVVGLTIGIIQAATQINEASVAFIPKLLVVGVVLLLAGPVSFAIFTDYMREIIMRIPSVIS